MTRIRFQLASGEVREIDATPGVSAMRNAIDQGIAGIVAECGGAAACGTCHVYVDGATLARLPAPESNEEAMLDFTAELRAATSRLSCQLVVSDALEGALFVLPQTQL